MNSTQKRTALITGASAGVGLALSRCFAQDGIHLIMVARNEQKLNEVAEKLKKQYAIEITIIAIDLTDPGAAEKLYNEIETQGIKIDYLVNNAGMGTHGAFSQSASTTNEAMININIIALTTLTRLFIPTMLKNDFGRILNVASLVAYQPGGPQAALYYASKSFVLSLSRGLSKELKNSAVTITALCPGPMHTAFQIQGGFAGTRLYQFFNSNTQQVAESAYRAMNCGKTTVIPGFINKLLAFGGEMPPRRIALTINDWLLKKPSTPTTKKEP